MSGLGAKGIGGTRYVSIFSKSGSDNIPISDVPENHCRS